MTGVQTCALPIFVPDATYAKFKELVIAKQATAAVGKGQTKGDMKKDEMKKDSGKTKKK